MAFCGVTQFSACDVEDPTPVITKMADEYLLYDASRFNREELKLNFELKGLRPSKQTRRYSDFRSQMALPESVSLDHELTENSPNQEHAGACKTFSNTASIEAAYFRKYQKIVKFSELWIIRLMIGESLLQNEGKGTSPAIYLGLTADEILWWSRHAGLCTQESLPYSSWPIERFDSLYRTGREDILRMAKDFIFFRDNLYEWGDKKLKSCAGELEQFRRELKGFNEIPIMDATSENLMKWLAFGIPLYYVARGYGSNDELNVPSPHAILLTGYNQKTRAFYLRNSWGPQGQFLISRKLNFDRIDRDRNDNSFSYFPTAVVSDFDIKRACVPGSNAPEELLEQCGTLTTTPDVDVGRP